MPQPPDTIGQLIEAGAALCQELQDVIDEALWCQGDSAPPPGSIEAQMQLLVDAWEHAYAAHTTLSLDL